MKEYAKRLPWTTALVLLFVLSTVAGSLALPSAIPHPHEAASIQWERDGSRDGSSSHNHRSGRSFRGFADSGEPYSAFSCWDNRIYRLDLVGTFNQGHCFINETGSAEDVPRFYFRGSNWPDAAKARVRDAFAAWSAITSDNPDLVTGIEFQETSTETNADIKLLWTDLVDTGASGACGGTWNFVGRTLSFDSTFEAGHGAWNFNTSPVSIGEDEWHFYSVALHEIGHIAGLGHQADKGDDVMAPGAGEPRSFDCNGDGITQLFFEGLDADSTEGVRDLYSQPYRRVAIIVGNASSYSPVPSSNAPAGVYTIQATFRNVSTTQHRDLFFRVTTLTGGNVVLNADGSPGGVGATISVPPEALGPNHIFDPPVSGTLFLPGESFTTQFEIGLAQHKSFTFMVYAYGVTVDGVTTTANIIGGFRFAVAEEQVRPNQGGTLYLPNPNQSSKLYVPNVVK